MSQFKVALPGERFGRLLVIGIIDRQFRRCVCDCGRELNVLRCNLRSGGSQSCGCLREEINAKVSVTHGASAGHRWTRAFRIRHGMIQRCMNPVNPQWADYGGRGITVCSEWLESFECFHAEMGDPPVGMSIERLDNDGPYCKANCIWASPIRQARNKRNNRVLIHNGESRTLAEWVEVLGLSYYTVHARLRRGWSPLEALSPGLFHLGPRGAHVKEAAHV